jgi:hypothetical protein
VTPVVTTLGFWGRVQRWAVVMPDRFTETAVLEAGSLLAILLGLAIGGRTFGFVRRGILARVTFRPTTLSTLIVGGVLPSWCSARCSGASWARRTGTRTRSPSAKKAPPPPRTWASFPSSRRWFGRSSTHARCRFAQPRSRVVTVILWAGILIGPHRRSWPGGVSRFSIP